MEASVRTLKLGFSKKRGFWRSLNEILAINGFMPWDQVSIVSSDGPWDIQQLLSIAVAHASHAYLVKTIDSILENPGTDIRLAIEFAERAAIVQEEMLAECIDEDSPYIRAASEQEWKNVFDMICSIHRHRLSATVLTELTSIVA